ncbi:MAG: flagellar biosynthesis protein FlhA [Spirochaetaceae bacterium]|nr:flagellar biosynthesis protein FlhA [Spirochaetaceae bacterium]
MADRIGKLFKSVSNNLVPIAAIVVVMMLIIPLPTWLLDVLMAANLLLALLMLLIVIYTPRAIDFSSFPSMLLISTVFGLGLNVSSTRLILSLGTKFNGKMVRAFSSFVVGANGSEGLLIGFVIFIIIIAVQTFVITKGATRVAEVAARFTLDAMPMKQAAIESEYNSGAISEEESRKRKMEVQREADFYGSMDGATKFISGNVKVGIFITVINLVVGIIFGMVLRNEVFGKAIQTYAALTIGDGLLSQLPSLLVSFATGLIVTRSASDGNMGDDIKKQFSQNAWVYFVGGITLAVIGVLPGFPWYVLIPMGAALVYLGIRLRKIEKKNFAAQLAKEKAKIKPGAKSGDPNSELSPVVPLDPLSLELGFALIPLVDKEKGAELLERITRIRAESHRDLGLVVPRIRIIDNMALEPNEYCFKIRGVPVAQSHIRMGWYMCMDTGGVIEEIQGEKTTDPAFGLPAIWITEENREKAERAGYAVVDPPTIIATHLTEIIKSHASEIIGRQEVQSIVDALRKDYPAVVDEVTKIFNMGEIEKVLQRLLREQVSVRNTVAILETMADFGPTTKRTDILVEKVRQALGRQICLQYTDENRTLHVMTIEPEFLQVLVDSRVDTVNGPMAALEPKQQRTWISALSMAAASVQEKGFVPVILCPEEARILVKASSEREMPGLVVLSVPEITNDIKVESLGEIKVG